MNNTLLIEEAKNYFQIPVHHSYKRYGWNSGFKDIFSAHALLTWENFDAMIDNNAVYEDFSEDGSFSKDQLIVHQSKYYKTLLDLATGDQKDITNANQFMETSPVYELIDKQISKAIDDVFDTWQENVTIETANGETIHNEYGEIYIEDAQAIDDTKTYGIRYIAHASQNTKIVVKTVRIFSRKDVTVTITVKDNNAQIYTEEASLVANKINEVTFATPFETYANEVIITLPNNSFLSLMEGYTDRLRYMLNYGVRNNEDEMLNNFGIKANVLYKCDYTLILKDNFSKFVRAVLNQFAVNCLEFFAYNPHSTLNRHEANISKEDMIYELDKAKDAGGISLRSKLYKSIKSVKADFFPKDGICVGCSTNNIEWSSM